MRHYGRRRRSFAPRAAITSIQHVPSSMGNVVPTNDQLLFFAIVPDVLAGESLGVSHITSDRERECATGTNVNFITWDIAFTPAAAVVGSISYVVFKAERQFVTPVVGTDPIPTDAEVIGAGLQAEYRKNMPGWIMKFGIIAMTVETTRSAKITVNLKKFRKSKQRDGDFTGLCLFNDTNSNVTMDIHCRYKQFT